MTKNSEEDKNEAGKHVDQTLKFFRDRQDILSHYGIEMEDLLFMEAMVEDTASLPLHNLYALGVNYHDEFDIKDMDQAISFIRGAILGYTLGLKSTWPNLDASSDDNYSGFGSGSGDDLVPQ